MKYFLFIFYFISTTCVAQKEYSFDYYIEYSFKSYVDSTLNKKVIYMTNSRDNSYFAKIEELDEHNFMLEFVAQDHIKSEVEVTKDNLFKAESLTINCNSDLIYKNRYKFRVKTYAYDILPDTLMNNTLLKSYRLKYVGDRKRKKSFSVGTNLYIVKDSTDFHLPILTHSTAFEEWKKEGGIPGGIYKEKIFYDYDDKLSYKFILNNYYPINKKIIIPAECLEE